MPGMPMKMVMVHGNSFFVQNFSDGPRGRNAFSVPNMFMVDVGGSIGGRNYINLDFMGTIEKWTFAKSGYPEILQIGEENQDHVPFIDAQHPHSSPIMGLTLSDTVSLGDEKDFFKFWFAPRGQSTDGPVAFMHRTTGMVNPDAPLGHHIGQDAGHISSTVLGSMLRLKKTTMEVSSFHGEEPEPTKVDLPMGKPDSFAARLTRELGEHYHAMASAAFVQRPESHDPELSHVWRYSASLYSNHTLQNGWMIHNALIWGMINFYDDTSKLSSFAEEFLVHKNKNSIWGRFELLQRTPAELEIVLPDNNPKWITALTIGYTYHLMSWDEANLGLGAALTKYFVPSEFHHAYGGNPTAEKIFLQLSGMKMWDY
jgi:hypothetical protein